jgi:ABC-type glycerol-3-phosphate transport system permease component
MMLQKWLSAINRPLRRHNLTLFKIPGWLFGLFIAALWAAPFVWMVSTSFKPAKEVMTKDIE